MAAAPLHSCSGLPGLCFFHALLGFWCTFVGSGSALTVIQTPSFVNVSTRDPTGISFSCSVDDTSYNIFLYRQLPGKTELKVLGYLSTGSTTLDDIPDELKDRLKGQGSTSTNPPFVGSGSALTVIQTPSFVNGSTTDPTGISFSCSVDDTSYRIFLYRQLPGKTELKVLGAQAIPPLQPHCQHVTRNHAASDLFPAAAVAVPGSDGCTTSSLLLWAPWTPFLPCLPGLLVHICGQWLCPDSDPDSKLCQRLNHGPYCCCSSSPRLRWLQHLSTPALGSLDSTSSMPSWPSGAHLWAVALP
ncbi:V-set and immunoglobulin domain-containing protein 2-like [Crotalus adamanteus]